MSYKRWFLGALALWLVTIGTAGYFFVKGQVLADQDSRTAVLLTELW